MYGFEYDGTCLEMEGEFMYHKRVTWIKCLIFGLSFLPFVWMPVHAGPGDRHGEYRHTGKNDKKPDRKRKHDEHRPAKRGVSRHDARRWAVQYRYTGYTPLPPGVRKNMMRGKPLPHGIAGHPVPPGMRRHLPHHDGYTWYRTGNDLVLIAATSGIVTDIMINVFR